MDISLTPSPRLSACDHSASATLVIVKPRFIGRSYLCAYRMFFRKASPQTEGRRDAHLLIETSPGTSRIQETGIECHT